MENKKSFHFDISSAGLHIIGMILMFLDHMWGTITPGQQWMTLVGRIAFPIFAFMIVEGYFHTSNYKKYLKRLVIFAALAEIPFDLMIMNVPFYPFHQNVLWTFLIAVIGIHMMEKVKAKGKIWKTILTSVLVVLVGFIVGTITMVDYFGAGVAIVFLFYFLRKRKWWCFLAQAVILYWICAEGIGGKCFFLNLFGHEFEIVEESMALLALIPIWLYKGRQGYHSKPFQYFCYAFYGGHILLLVILQQLL